MVYVKIFPRSTRLGNWMFQYAAAKTAHPDELVSFVITEAGYADRILKYAEVFQGVEVVNAVPQNCEVRIGLYQDSKYVDRAVAKALYRCPARIDALLKRRYGSLLEKNNLVSIHVRRGDYMKLPHRHPFVGEAYLTESVARFPDSQFLVCSDDISWCKKFFAQKRFPGLTFHFSEGNDVLSDLFLMTKCRGGHICSNSSFSWWGAYLGEGKTIFPSMWYGVSVRDIEWGGLYFEGSEVLKNRYSRSQYAMALLLNVKNLVGQWLRWLHLYK